MTPIFFRSLPIDYKVRLRLRHLQVKTTSSNFLLRQFTSWRPGNYQRQLCHSSARHDLRSSRYLYITALQDVYTKVPDYQQSQFPMHIHGRPYILYISPLSWSSRFLSVVVAASSSRQRTRRTQTLSSSYRTILSYHLDSPLPSSNT